MIQPSDYEFLCDFLINASGLSLGSGKEYLVEARLVPLAQSWGLDDIEGLVRELQNGAEKRLVDAVTEAMTTNETSFFRDKTPFDELRDLMLPNLIESRRQTRLLRIWCAAGSTGQEPYSIEMLLLESFPHLNNWDVEILVTDIDSTVLNRAENGIYSQFEVQRGLPITLLMKYFEQVPDGWQIKTELKNRIRWMHTNLLRNFQHLGMFDIIFCRNVLIYFDSETKKQIFERLDRVIRRDGYLILGAAETTLGITAAFERDKRFQAAIHKPRTVVTAQP